MISRLVEFAVKDEFGVARPGGRERHERNDSQVMRLVRAAVRRGLEGHEQDLQQAVDAAVTPIIDAEVWQALKAALESGSQTAVVSAARLLVTELYEEREDEDRAAESERANARAKQRLAELLATRARASQRRQLGDLLEELTARLEEEAVSEHPELLVGDVSPERISATLAEQMAQERLTALKQEHGLA
jgi:hypothetical protein